MNKCALDGLEVPATYKIKLSGDGAKMTRITGFIVISLSILNDGDNPLSPKGVLSVTTVYATYQVTQEKQRESSIVLPTN